MPKYHLSAQEGERKVLLVKLVDFFQTLDERREARLLFRFRVVEIIANY